MGWMSPEEIEWDNGGSARGIALQAHLSGDIHTAGSIIYYTCTSSRTECIALASTTCDIR